jgi:hypothetical protein
MPTWESPLVRALSAAASACERPLLVGTDLRTTVKPSLFGGHVTFWPSVVVVFWKVVVPNVVVENVVVESVVVGGLIVIVGCGWTPTVLVVCGFVETMGTDVAGPPLPSSSVAARATTAPDTTATRRSAARAAQSQKGESRRQISP